jgi:uncharacterized protein YbjQ (UPF0145 family)
MARGANTRVRPAIQAKAEARPWSSRLSWRLTLISAPTSLGQGGSTTRIVAGGVNAFKDIGAGMRNIFGGRSRSYENELASGISDALAEMEKQAAHLGADAVIGVDLDYETVGNNMLMVSASGTAVKLG